MGRHVHRHSHRRVGPALIEPGHLLAFVFRNLGQDQVVARFFWLGIGVTIGEDPSPGRLKFVLAEDALLAYASASSRVVAALSTRADLTPPPA
jgi:hypothetical protein